MASKSRFIATLAACAALAAAAIAWARDPALAGAPAKRGPRYLTVRKFSPGARKKRVDPATKVVLSFSEPLDETTVPENVDLSILFGKSVGWSYRLRGKRLTLTPAVPLETSTDYQIEVRPGLLSKSGRTLKRRKASLFFTSGNPSDGNLATSELADLSAHMLEPRAAHTANVISGGRVLLAGGQTNEVRTVIGTDYFYAAGAEVFDPDRNEFTALANPLAGGRAYHASIVARNRVWLIGGRNEDGPLATTAAIEVGTLGVSAGPQLTEPRDSPAVAVLPGDSFLVVGGTHFDDAGSTVVSTTAELFDTSTNQFRRTLNDPLRVRDGCTATALADGRILIVGGTRLAPGFLATAEIFDPATETFTETAAALEHRQFHTTTSLGNGRYVVLDGGSLNVEVYDAIADTWSVACGESAPGRVRAAALLVPELGVLVVGGSTAGSSPPARLNSMELYIPTSGEPGQIVPVVLTLSAPRNLCTLTPLVDGRFLIAGGSGPQYGTNLNSVTVFLSPSYLGK